MPSPLGKVAARRADGRGQYAFAPLQAVRRMPAAPLPTSLSLGHPHLRAKSRLRRLRSETRLRAQPKGEGFYVLNYNLSSYLIDALLFSTRVL